MPLDLTPLDSASRLLVEATLRVAPGSGGRFQPTGFPDLGPALYKGIRSGAGGDAAELIDMLLVESVQSMANRLEDVCLEGEDYNTDCQGIPYVRVLDGHAKDAFLTSSLREPHRLGSNYVLGAKGKDGVVFREVMKKALSANKGRPVHIWKMARAIFDQDPGCVLHGVFLDELDGRIRLPRLLSAYIEACSPNQVNSGGVCRGEVTAKDNIPYSRQEFTSATIAASFIFHISTLKSYGLSADQNRFLQSWALYKIDRFIRQHLRLRTACEFEKVGLRITLDGRPVNLGAGKGEWPSDSDIRTDFLSVKKICFPELPDGDEYAKRRIAVVTHRVDIVGQEGLAEGLTADKFALADFAGRAEIKKVTEVKAKKKREFSALVISGEWPEEDRTALLASHPEKTEDDDGNEIENPAYLVVEKALKKWTENWKKAQKKAGGTEDSGDEA